jgi:hypothetical protein
MNGKNPNKDSLDVTYIFLVAEGDFTLYVKFFNLCVNLHFFREAQWNAWKNPTGQIFLAKLAELALITTKTNHSWLKPWITPATNDFQTSSKAMNLPFPSVF